MSEKTLFIVTEKAGPWVAGKRSPGAGEEIRLTEAQAKYALIAGELERPAKTKTTAKATSKTKPAAKPDTEAETEEGGN